MRLLSSKEITQNIVTARSAGKRSIAYLPVGCTEQHGPFLPIETDSLIAEIMTLDLSERLSDFAYGYVFPTVSYTPTQSNAGVCGTVSVFNDSFRQYMTDVCRGIMQSPFDALVILCGHSGIESSLKEIGFWIVNDQYNGTNKEDIRPVLVLSIFEACHNLGTIFQQPQGRHADWREFLFLFQILGEDYFSQKKLASMRQFQAEHSFDYIDSEIYGVPVFLRSIDGIIGDPLPASLTQPKQLAVKAWSFIIDYLANKITSEFDAFWHKYGNTHK